MTTLNPREAVGPSVNGHADGPVLRAVGHEMKVLLSGEDTGRQCTMLLDTVPPGVGVPPHLHEHEDEWFYVLESRAEFWTA